MPESNEHRCEGMPGKGKRDDSGNEIGITFHKRIPYLDLWDDINYSGSTCRIKYCPWCGEELK